MELRDLRVALRRHWLVALVALLVCLLAGGYAALSVESTYEATATLSVEPNPDASGDGGSGVAVTNFLIPALIERLSSSPYREEARATLPDNVADASVRVRPTVESGTGIVKVTVEAEDPDIATQWANALALVSVQSQGPAATAPTTPTTAAGDATTPEDLSRFLDVTLVEPAARAQPAGGGDRTAILVASGVLGVLAAVFAALVASRTRRALDPTAEVRARLGVPVLAAIPRVNALRGRALAPLMTEKPVPTLEESFRQLRTAVELRLARERPDSIAITSLSAGEGKTTITVGLALALASVGHDVVLLDADLRRPSVHTALGVPMGREGVSDWARKDTHPELHRSNIEQLAYLTAGTPDRHPADVTALALSRALSAYAKPGRLVLLDAPPLDGAAETPLVLDAASHVIVVVDAASSRIPELAPLLDELQSRGVAVLGVVLNRARKPRRGKGDYYAYVTPRTSSPANGAAQAPARTQAPVEQSQSRPG